MKLDDVEPGQRVLYVPHHAHGNQLHADCEPGIVTSKNDRFAFVRYYGKTQTQATDPIDLVLTGPADSAPA